MNFAISRCLLPVACWASLLPWLNKGPARPSSSLGGVIMVRAGACLLAILSGCAHVVDEEGPPATAAASADLVLPADAEGRDFAARVEGSARCEEAARA